MVCHGPNCVVFFTSVSFQNCCLVVLDGAYVVLEHSTFIRSSSCAGAAPEGLSIFAHGSGTSVGMHGGSIAGGVQAVTVQVLQA